MEKKNKQIIELLKQQDQVQQLVAMHQKTIDKLTGQNQLLIEASQEKEEKKVGLWDYYRDQSTAETFRLFGSSPRIGRT